ncbi:MAG: hypothetical protein Q9223_004055 [Gallowayella weberi]
MRPNYAGRQHPTIKIAQALRPTSIITRSSHGTSHSSSSVLRRIFIYRVPPLST